MKQHRFFTTIFCLALFVIGRGAIKEEETAKYHKAGDVVVFPVDAEIPVNTYTTIFVAQASNVNARLSHAASSGYASLEPHNAWTYILDTSQLEGLLGQAEVRMTAGKSEGVTTINITSPAPLEPAYRIGVNYHATTSDFDQTDADGDGYLGSAFIRSYNNPVVQAKVQQQLKSMADSGVYIIKTCLWQVEDPASRSNYGWKLAFPLSSQELQNIQRYAQDVANICANDGHYLSLQLSLAWLWCADYTTGSSASTVGKCGLSWSEFLNRARQTVSNLYLAVESIRRPDGRKVVELIYLDGEVMVQAKPNQERFLLDLYPYFMQKSASTGIPGSVYFIIAAQENEILDNGFTDPTYPILNGHRCLYWLYRSVNFMRTNNLAVPPRLDFSFYPTRTSSTYAALIDRVWDDIQAVFPSTQVGVAETYYLQDSNRRRALGQAFASEFLKRGIPRHVIFWTTPNGGGTGVNTGFPFDFGAYLPKKEKIGTVTNGGPLRISKKKDSRSR
jgi:hypothetical protein